VANFFEDDDALYTVFIFYPLWILLTYGIGWCLGWGIEAVFIGEPYETAIGLDLKVVIGIIIGLWWGILHGAAILLGTYR